MDPGILISLLLDSLLILKSPTLSYVHYYETLKHCFTMKHSIMNELTFSINKYIILKIFLKTLKYLVMLLSGIYLLV